MSTNEAPRKFDHGKPQLNLIPTVALVEMGKVLAFGAQKYDRGNWAKGLATSRYFDAAQRHLLAWNAGENVDPESGISHLAHAMVNLAFMVWNMVFRPDLDDRWHISIESARPTETKTTFEAPWYAVYDGGTRVSPVYVNTELCRLFIMRSESRDAPSFTVQICDLDGKRV